MTTVVARFLGAIGGVPLHYLQLDRRRKGGGSGGGGGGGGGGGTSKEEQRRVPPNIPATQTTTTETSETTSPETATDKAIASTSGYMGGFTTMGKQSEESPRGGGSSDYVTAAGRPFARGHFGEVWRARAVTHAEKGAGGAGGAGGEGNGEGSGSHNLPGGGFVLKRLFVVGLHKVECSCP